MPVPNPAAVKVANAAMRNLMVLMTDVSHDPSWGGIEVLVMVPSVKDLSCVSTRLSTAMSAITVIVEIALLIIMSTTMTALFGLCAANAQTRARDEGGDIKWPIRLCSRFHD
jgi:hypothetical protein